MSSRWFAVLVTICHLALATKVHHCNDESKPMPLGVRISNCEDPPCQMGRGTNVTLEIDFEAGIDLMEIKTVVDAWSLGVHSNYPLPDDDVCSSLTNGECPLDKGEVVTYKLFMPILTSFPTVHAIIEFSLVSGSYTVACLKTAADVVDK